jgi:hypothetical protein
VHPELQHCMAVSDHINALVTLSLEIETPRVFNLIIYEPQNLFSTKS